MVLNIVFLLGGICVGYLIRGEVQRKKSNKVMAAALEAGLEVVKQLTESDKEEKESKDDEIIDLEDVWNSDETIKL